MARPVIAVDGRYGLRSPRRGVGEYIYQLLWHLKDRERPYDIHVYGDQTADQETAARLGAFYPVTILAAPNFFLWEQVVFPRAAKKANLVHGTANIAPLDGRVPRVLTVHDVIEWHRGKDFPSKIPPRHHLSRLYRMNALKYLAPRAKALFTVSYHAQKDIAQTLGVDEKKIHVTPLAAKMPVLEPFWPKEDYFLVLGALDPRKNIRTVLDAWRTWPKAPRLEVVGGEPAFVQAARAWCRQAGLLERVHVRGMVSDAELLDLYRKAAGFIYLSHYEGFGLPVLEAMAVGCPVIAGDQASLPEVVGEAGLLVSGRDPEALTAAVRRLWGDTALQEALVRKGVEQAKRFSWERTAELTDLGYRRVLGLL